MAASGKASVTAWEVDGVPRTAPEDYARLLSVLESIRHTDEAPQLIALHLLGGEHVRWVSIKRLHRDGAISTAAAFGTRTCFTVKMKDVLQIWMDLPLCRSLRTGAVYCAVDSADPEQLSIIVPIRSRGVTLGAITCQTSNPGPERTSHMAAILSGAARLLALTVLREGVDGSPSKRGR